ncbi:hypothetical protein VTN31DRAFT_4448 [Thermomyces dupontii]|uniref:uncharacterized protein n=1 Tax=Talaromyces thermophilus TaxID=28565 RepID=UPI003742E13A
MSFIKKLLSGRKKKGDTLETKGSFDPWLRSAYFKDSYGRSNRGVQLEWMHTPVEASDLPDNAADWTGPPYSMRLELRILNLPPLKPLAPGVDRTAKLDLRMTGTKCHELDEWYKVKNKVIFSTDGWELRQQGMEEPAGNSSAAKDPNSRPYYLVIENFKVPYAQPGHTYFIEVRLQIQGLNRKLLPRPFTIWYNPRTGYPEPSDVGVSELDPWDPEEEKDLKAIDAILNKVLALHSKLQRWLH